MGDLENILIQHLRDYLSAHPDFKQAFTESFNNAKSTGVPQFEEYGIDTFDDYIKYYNDFLRWTPSENHTADNVYLHLCLFYFVIDLPPVNGYQSSIKPRSAPPIEPWTWLTQWLILYAKEVGKFMDTPESLTRENLQTFYRAKEYHMEDYEEPAGRWKNFNEFFSRHIKPEARPITAIDDPTIIVSPADSTFSVHWTIDDDAHIDFEEEGESPKKGVFSAKGVPWNIYELLQDTAFADRFKGGQFTHAFLGPTDYHRQHAPVAGKVVEAKVVPGICYLQVAYELDGEDGVPRLVMRRKLTPKIAPYTVGAPSGPNGEPDPHRLEAPNEPGYQFLQARGVIVIDNPDIGLVAVCPIGMAQISSVVLTVKEGDIVKKGDEISCFQFGGSDIVLLFEARSNVTITAKEDTHYNFGTKIATAQRISN